MPYKPTKKEAYELIKNKINGTSELMTFEDAYKKYISAKSNVLSPSTLRGYSSMFGNMPEWLKSMDITKIDNYSLQRFVNEYSANHSPKSTSNMYSLILTVIRLFIPNVGICATLPQKRRKNDYSPSLEDVKKLLDYSKNTKYGIPLYLASLSLRCSEICALKIEDLKPDNSITINKALVRGENGYVLKNVPKTDAGYRTIVIPRELADRIRENGCIYNGYPNQIDKYLYRTLPKLGIPTFSMHKLRHFFASYSHELGYSDAQIQSLGGWNSDVMKRVYRHAMNIDEAKQTIASDFSFS